ncbi:hypothetical protein NMY22_g6347 [Coprinellus aureogranulatus]|nr:hypothetical protein NMY22_g6347 [Coprinellus aureogranulatus]
MDSSLNLNTLVHSLPSQQNAEKALLNDFKAAALSITTLYRSSRKNAKRAYNTGYATACQDLLSFIQHNVSVTDSSDNNDARENPSGMVSKVMDWAEARLDAIKATEEDEEEDEERENANSKERRGRSADAAVQKQTASVSGNVKKNANAVASTSRILQSASTLPTPHSPNPSSSPSLPPEQPSSPSPPPVSTALRPHNHQRLNKLRGTPAAKSPDAGVPFLSTQSSSIPSSIVPTGGVTTPATHIPSALFSSNPTTPTPAMGLEPVVIGAGAKRRHAMMMMMDPTSGAFGIGGTPTSTPAANEGVAARRRTRSTRSLGLSTVHNQNVGQGSDDMDVEEEGRERKRVARR